MLTMEARDGLDSSRIRVFSARVHTAYRRDRALISSSRAVVLIFLMPVLPKAIPWGAFQMRQRPRTGEHFR